MSKKNVIFVDEFEKLVGESVPYHRLGFTSLRQLLNTIDGLKMVWNEFGEQTLRINDSKISHIDRLIRKQKVDYSKTKVCLITQTLYSNYINKENQIIITYYFRTNIINNLHDRRAILIIAMSVGKRIE